MIFRSLIFIALLFGVVGCSTSLFDDSLNAAAAKHAASSAERRASEESAAPVVPVPVDEHPIGLQDSRPDRTTGDLIVPATGPLINRAASGGAAASADAAGDITLNFVNADVREVIKTVLGTYLNLNYVMDPEVQGTINIQTSRALSHDAALSALTTALRLSGVAIVKVAGVYRVVPLSHAQTQGEPLSLPGGASGDFKLEIIPLRFVGVADIQQVLQSTAPPGTIVRVDSARNLIILGGSPDELSGLVATINVFDVDQMAGMSFALFPLREARAKDVAGELRSMLALDSGPIAGVVRLQVIERLNGILVVSAQPAYLERVQDFIARLDRTSAAAERQLYVYSVQNGRALDLATVLAKALGVSGGSGTSSSSSASAPAGDRTQVTYTPLDQTNSPSSSLGSVLPFDSRSQDRAPNTAADGSTGSDDRSRGNERGGRDQMRITADENNNALLIMATAHEYSIVEAALKKIDVVPLQVLIEASIIEVTLNNSLQYGVEYFVKSGNNNTFVQTTAATASVASSLPGFSYIYSSGSNLQVIVNLLKSVTDVNVLSAPEIVVLNNQTASLQVGDEVPVATQSASSVLTAGAPIVNSISFRDTGVILKVTPRVNASGLVSMDISQEVSAVTQTTTSGIDSPTIQQRKVSSSVAVDSGQTVALGGLITNNRTRIKNGIPILGDIPYLGYLFNNTTDSWARTELIVLITPKIIRNQRDARNITQELREKLSLTLAVQ